jgi:hypothetical protein
MTYTLAIRPAIGDSFVPVPNVPKNLSLGHAQRLAAKYRDLGFDVVAFNSAAQ